MISPIIGVTQPAGGIKTEYTILLSSALNSNIDTTAPRISNWVIPTELNDAKLEIASGESGKLIFKATPFDLNDAGNIGAGFNYLNITWTEAISGTYRYLSLSSSDLIDGVVSGILDMSFAKSGNWSIQYANMTDKANNHVYFNAGSTDTIGADKFKTAGIDLSKLNFSLIKQIPLGPRLVVWVEADIQNWINEQVLAARG